VAVGEIVAHAAAIGDAVGAVRYPVKLTGCQGWKLAA
jgi:hypothetical protein